jgi:hypothetical protein
MDRLQECGRQQFFGRLRAGYGAMMVDRTGYDRAFSVATMVAIFGGFCWLGRHPRNPASKGRRLLTLTTSRFGDDCSILNHGESARPQSLSFFTVVNFFAWQRSHNDSKIPPTDSTRPRDRGGVHP